MSDDNPCVIKPGQSVIVVDHGYVLPDGTITSTVANCDFQDGSAIAFSYPNGPPPSAEVTASSITAEEITATVVEEVTPVVSVDVSPTSVMLPSEVSSSQVDPVTAAIVATVAVAALGSAASSMSTNKSKRTKVEQRQQKEREKEEQEKCDTASDAVADKIKATISAIDASPINKSNIKEPAELYAKIDKLQQEVVLLTKVIKKREKKKDP